MSGTQQSHAHCFTLAQQFAIIGSHTRLPSGTPLINVVEAAESELGLNASGLRLYERAAQAFDALHTRKYGCKPQRAQQNGTRATLVVATGASSSSRLVLSERRKQHLEVKLDGHKSPREERGPYSFRDSARTERSPGVPVKVGELNMVLVV